MKLFKINKDEINYSTHILGDPYLSDNLADYTYPFEAMFFAQINLLEYEILGLNEGFLYIFFDLSGYYSDEFGEYSFLPMAYYTLDNPTIILDDFNENHNLKGIKETYILKKGEGFDINNGIITISDGNILPFFMNFDNDIKKVMIEFTNIKLNEFNEGNFKIEK